MPCGLSSDCGVLARSLKSQGPNRKAGRWARLSRKKCSSDQEPNGLKLFVPLKICPMKLVSSPPDGVLRLMKSKTWPS